MPPTGRVLTTRYSIVSVERLTMALLARLWSLRKRRPGFVATSILTLLLLFGYPAVESAVRSAGLAQQWNYQDFTVYTGAVEAWQSGEPIYVPNDDGGFWGRYLYPPIFLALFRPFAALSHYDAGLAWGVLSVGLLWVALQLVVAQLGARLAWWERLLLLWALIGFHPLLLSVKMGQTAGFLAALLSFALAALLWADRTGDELGESTAVPGRPAAYASGALTAFVGTFKLAYAPVGAHLLADRDRFVGAVAAGVGLLGLSVAVFGVETHLAYLDVLAWGVERGGGGERVPKPSLWLPPYYRQLHWLPGALAIRLGIAVVVSLAALLARDADRSVFALGVATFLLITPLPYAYYFVAALPAVVASLAVELELDLSGGATGYPTAPVVVALLLHVHSYGLRFLGEYVPKLVGEIPDLAYPLLQPGLWGVVLFFGLTLYRVGRAVAVPDALADLLPVQ
ncbi:MAG: glycosyltransferase family 87 protein [Haloferacaceae archaeon]